MFTGHNCDLSKQFRNQCPGIATRYFLNSEVSKPIIKPDENVSKSIMKLKYNKYIYCPFLQPWLYPNYMIMYTIYTLLYDMYHNIIACITYHGM